MNANLKSPYPYFGGKSRVALLIWERLGNVDNFVDPFFGSGAVLLARPQWHFQAGRRTETVNDLDGYLCNFWRALQAAPEEVARWADWPVSECDLLARHKWLIEQRPDLERLKVEPDFYDAKVAGWWVWGMSCWIGAGFCAGETQRLSQMPYLSRNPEPIARFPFKQLQKRVREVRVVCGDWERVLGPSVTFRHGLTGIILDPPYGEGSMDYSAGGNRSGIAQEVAAWAAENGDNPLLRIAYCGYEGAVEFPSTWECVEWKAAGGYGSQGDGAGRENCTRERIWFNASCIKPQLGLFS